MQCVGYLVLAVYLDKVLPDRMGVRLPLWYPLLPSYWKPIKVITFPADGSVSCSPSVPDFIAHLAEMHFKDSVGKSACAWHY